MWKRITPLMSKKMLWGEIGRMRLIMLILISVSSSNFSTILKYEIITAMQETYNSGKIQKINDINIMLRGIFRTVPVFFAVCIAMAIRHYRSFYQNSMSIYTIRRIKNPLEMHVRCLAVPLLLFLVMFALSMLTLSGFVATYLNTTPAAYLPEYHGIDFWRLFV